MKLIWETLIKTALLEDLEYGDVTTDNLPLDGRTGSAELRTRSDGVVSGLQLARQVFHTVDPGLRVTTLMPDGSTIQAGQTLMRVTGDLGAVLRAERTALNFLQHLSGIATTTRQYVDAVAGTETRITDTRKTTPGLRLAERMAVRHGGGHSHRMNLGGGAAMLKDNHLLALGGIQPAVQALRETLSHTCRIEVEVETLAEVAEAVAAGADIVLLDNMSPEEVREAVQLVNGRAITEASGGICLETARSYAETGVQYLSTSRITLGAQALDIGLDFLPEAGSERTR